MATTDLIGTPQRADHPTASLPPAAVSAMARIEYALAPVVAEQHRIERLVGTLRVGESTVINGTPVTVIDLETAELLERDARVAAMSPADIAAHELASYVRRPAASAEHEKTKDELPKRPRGPHPRYAKAGS